MSTKAAVKSAVVALPRDTTVLLPPCPECGGVECHTPRIPVCCENCGH